MKFIYSENKYKRIIKREINGKLKFSKKIDPNKLNIRILCSL